MVSNWIAFASGPVILNEGRFVGLPLTTNCQTCHEIGARGHTVDLVVELEGFSLYLTRS
jgi:hypothetical protein